MNKKRLFFYSVLGILIYIVAGTFVIRGQGVKDQEILFMRGMICIGFPVTLSALVLSLILLRNGYKGISKPRLVFWITFLTGSGVVIFTCLFSSLLASTSTSNKCQNNLKPGGDFSRCDLSEKDLSGLDLTGANLNHVNFDHADLSNTILTNANMQYVNLTGANITGAQLKGVDLDGSNLDSVIGLTNEMLSNISSWYGMTLEKPGNIIDKFRPVCQGTKVSASKYVENEKFHPLILISEVGYWTFRENNRIWYPGKAELNELVACVDEPEPQLVQRCEYTNTTDQIRRWRYKAEVHVHLASTGETIFRETIFGSPPKETCPKNFEGFDRDIYGSKDFDDKDLLIALEKFVNPSGENNRLTIP